MNPQQEDEDSLASLTFRPVAISLITPSFKELCEGKMFTSILNMPVTASGVWETTFRAKRCSVVSSVRAETRGVSLAVVSAQIDFLPVPAMSAGG